MPLIKKELPMSKWRVTVGVSTIEHEHRLSLAHDAEFNGPVIQLNNVSQQRSSFF